MPKLPKKLKILAHDYKVKEVVGLNDAGSFDSITNTILINKNMSIDQKWVGLFHEVLHALNVEIQDDIVEFLAQTLYYILKINNLLK